MEWRLDSKARDVADAFRRATPEKQRRAASAASEIAASLVSLEGDEVKAALRAVREQGSGDRLLQERLNALSARLDDEYFRLDEEGETKKPDALRYFSQARAASALAFALSEDEAQLHEAIYEALSSVFDDPIGVLRAVEAELK